MTAIIEGAIGWAVGRLADTATVGLKTRLNDQLAKRELSKLIGQALDDAIEIVPQLAEHLRDEAFLRQALVPSVLHALNDPTHALNPDEIAALFLDRYVERFNSRQDTNETLARIFLTERPAFDQAFMGFLASLETQLYASKHWAECTHFQATEEIRRTGKSCLGILQNLQQALPSPPPDLTPELARADAYVASEILRAWPQAIEGQHIERPELTQIIDRIWVHPGACTLVTGEAGSGKSALFAELATRLPALGMNVFAIKADKLPADIRNQDELAKALGLNWPLIDEISALASHAPVVVLIDQLDAVSEIMDRTSDRMYLLLQVAHHFLPRPDQATLPPPVHVLVSSREFEASFDGRFRNLKAETIKLELPGYEQIVDLLTRLGIPGDDVPPALHETIRRPFALKLFVDIHRRGIPTQELVSAELLSTWLRTANLGEKRAETLAFLQKLADDMTVSATLWRPAKHYEIDAHDALAAALACGIVVPADGQKIGFTHQAWLDDFQAKGFTTARKLADYAWAQQNRLFARATILRGLQSLRAHDVAEYDRALDFLLGEPVTRRHLRHLVADLIAGQSQANPREIAWAKKILREDAALANRLLARTTERWEAWREAVRDLLPTLMLNPELRWHTQRALVAEAKYDEAHTIALIGQYWDKAESDYDALQVFSDAILWTPAVLERMRLMAQRQKLENYTFVRYAEQLGDARAAELFGALLTAGELNLEEGFHFYDLHKLAERLPVAFSQVLLPWFVNLASLETDESSSIRDTYPDSLSLHWNWNDEHQADGVFFATKSALRACAAKHPKAFVELIQPYLAVEAEAVQVVLADALTAGGVPLAEVGAEFLIADTRRLQLGTASVADADNIGHAVTGWWSLKLLESVTPNCCAKTQQRLLEYVEDWNPYTEAAWNDDDARVRHERIGWAEDKRLRLLAALPENLLSPRRLRQVTEWRESQPVLNERPGLRVVSNESSMSPAQMAKASEEDIFGMIESLAEGHAHRESSIHNWRRGSLRDFSYAFAEFTKQHPERARKIAERFQPNRHERVSGVFLAALAEVEHIAPDVTLTLIWQWHAAGCSGERWTPEVAHALEKLASRTQGLAESEIALLESWIADDANVAATNIRQRQENEARNRESRHRQDDHVRSLVFRSMGGFGILPHGNFVFLSAMWRGLLQRQPPDYEGWVAALERHLERADDPATWTALLIHRGDALHGVDPVRANTLLENLWQRYSEALLDRQLVHFLWRSRNWISPALWQTLRDAWLASDDSKTRQAASELLMATVLLEPDNYEAAARLDQLFDTAPASPERLGAMFTIATVWNEPDPRYRQQAHDRLVRLVPGATGDEAVALATALTQDDALNDDAQTRELLEAASHNPEILKACVTRNFAESLQGLLNYPGMETLVLGVVERCTDLILRKEARASAFHLAEDFVSIAVALQRQDGPLLARAMDVYERLLDAHMSKAQEAADAALSRA